MRSFLRGDQDAGPFAKKLLRIGDGKVPHVSDGYFISIPQILGTMISSAKYLQSRVYQHVLQHYKDMECAILAPHNESVKTMNWKLRQNFPGEATSYKSMDKAM